MEPRKGTLYFISESDLLTGKGTGYFKIGLVNDSRSGGSAERAGEHQTGNPRKLAVHAEVNSPAIRELETLMHALWAPSRVLGEWFAFSTRELPRVVASAEAYAGQQSEIESEIQRSKRNSDTFSNGKTRKPTSEELEWLSEYKQAYAELKAIKEISEVEASLFQRVFDENDRIGELFAWRSRSSSERFDKKRFQEAHPDLFEQYSVLEKKSSGTFAMTKPKSGEIVIPRSLTNLLSEQSSAIDSVGRKPTESQLREIHLRHLAIRSLYGDSSWREDVAAMQIKAACGKYDGIDGVVKWARTEKESFNFSAITFKAENPALYKKFCTTSVTTKFEIKNMRAYP